MTVDTENATAHAETATTTAHALALIWGEVLQSASVPNLNDDFFELGGDSMGMVQVEARITEEFGVELPPGIMLNTSTLGSLAKLIETLERH
jgi:acyl carrier protein